jgi:octaprenyl-diphosphate synthase
LASDRASQVTINSLPTRAKAPALDLVAGELKHVERRIAEVIQSREPRLTTISDYLINAGGKRVRPAVAMLVFRGCGGSDITDMVDLSVSLELIHTATLLHDDIIDSNDVRRGKDAAPVRFGIADTLVTGDFLFSRAFEVCGRFEAKIVHWAADACIKLTEGEIMQGRFRRNRGVTYEDYLEIIARKTASLFAVGARIAAYLAGMPETAVERLDTCGREIGLAFQIIDDLLDVEGHPEKMGKRLGTDLFDGNPSLPVICGLDLPSVAEAFTTEGCSPALVQSAIDELRASDVLAHVRERAISHASRAAEIIRTLEPSEYRDALSALVCDLVDREL